MESETESLDQKKKNSPSLGELLFPDTNSDSNWTRNYGWQLVTFSSLILGVGFYFIFVNSPIKAVRLMPNIPKTYGTYARPTQIEPIRDNDQPMDELDQKEDDGAIEAPNATNEDSEKQNSTAKENAPK